MQVLISNCQSGEGTLTEKYSKITICNKQCMINSCQSKTWQNYMAVELHSLFIPQLAANL